MGILNKILKLFGYIIVPIPIKTVNKEPFKSRKADIIEETSRLRKELDIE